MDYEELRELAVAASRMQAGSFGNSSISYCHWLYIGTCPNYEVPGRQLVLISLFSLFLIIAETTNIE